MDTASATLAIEAATGWVQDATGQRIVAVTNDTASLLGGSCDLWLPQRPVTAVGTVSTTDRWGVSTARVLNTDYTVVGSALVWVPSGVWPPSVTVTYSHGFAVVPQALRGVCLAAAARVYGNPAMLRSETVGSVSWTAAGSAGDAGPGLTGNELAQLGRYRVPVVA